ncbi:MAG TPA: secretin N-terminal domain-containing protein, partial [Stellaceae bacterium]
LLVVAACTYPTANPGEDLRTLPEKMEQPAALTPTSPLIAGPAARQTRVVPGPAPPSAPAAPVPIQPSIRVSGEPVSLTIEQMPLPAFINTVFGETLHLSFEIDPRLAQRTDPVTLRTGRPLPPSEILALANAVLRDYGISVIATDRLVRIVPSEALLSQSPVVIRGRSSREIAENLRPIYEYLPLANVSANDMAGWLQTAFGTKVRVSPAPQANAILVLGLPEDVEAANEAIGTLDQPRLAGRRSVRIEPVFWSPSQLAERLADILRAEGYSVGTNLQNPGALIMLPLRPSNTLVVFAADQKTLSHVEDWARDLDRVSQVDPQRSVFYYGVRNTTAESLANVLNAVLAGAIAARGAATTPEPGPPPPGAPPGLPPAPPPPGVASTPSGPAPGNLPARIVTDPARNAIIFQGSAEEFAQLRPLIESLDQAAREAIIEATVAEVTLTDNETLGAEWVASLGARPNEIIQNIGTGIGMNAFTFTVLNRAGATRLILNALASNNRVKVLSTPKLLARSGGEARIQVGAQVPIVTSQGTSSQLQQAGTSAILQTIQYRDTGVILSVKPTIYAGNHIDLEIKQEVSEAVQNNTSGLSTPVINNRTVNTQLSLQDGATVLLGGLIMENSSSNTTGVPFLKDIPGVGFLFGTQQAMKTRSELFVFITPYIIQSGEDAERLAEMFKNRYQSMPQPASTLHW